MVLQNSSVTGKSPAGNSSSGSPSPNNFRHIESQRSATSSLSLPGVRRNTAPQVLTRPPLVPDDDGKVRRYHGAAKFRSQDAPMITHAALDNAARAALQHGYT